jgi:AraC-like DNA-binding protein
MSMTATALIATRPGPAGTLGGIRYVGRILAGRGIPARTARSFPMFGLMYVFGGAGRYRDANHDLPLTAGDLVFVLPNHAHWYGVTDRGVTWNEVYIVFDGPVFRTAAAAGLMDATDPVHHLAPVRYWLHRMDQFRTRRTPRTTAGRDAEACDLLRLLTDINARTRSAEPHVPSEDWFVRSQQALEGALGETVDLHDVATEVGMPYETWRRRFQARAGTPPAEYRRLHRIDAAGTLLTDTSLSVREIAANLGFADEHHLNRQFRTAMGMTPRAYRNQNA